MSEKSFSKLKGIKNELRSLCDLLLLAIERDIQVSHSSPYPSPPSDTFRSCPFRCENGWLTSFSQYATQTTGLGFEETFGLKFDPWETLGTMARGDNAGTVLLVPGAAQQTTDPITCPRFTASPGDGPLLRPTHAGSS
ncbi:hypothetical protein AAFF_G00378900 [Aldrovandia affinis]|uniref:Uncharacterized protein n=1 Tax=Aldrovandia affinis TaxID=143900 RepID=A0AAD7SFL9_9TELE|nr:hypothetical protein AAFF_G00378900 [Aldrovandia affinis]